MDKAQRKKLLEQYKARTVVGGIYRVVNRENGRFYLQSTDDLQATRNWFASCKMFGNCSLPPIQKDWALYGMDAFALEELDSLKKGQDLTLKEFQAELKVLLAFWDEKLPRENRY